MDVTESNFNLILPQFLSLFETCDFWAMDQEMTGIRDPGGECDHPTAPLETVYPVKAAAAKKFCAFQVGICLFHKVNVDGEKVNYEARPFNFWLRQRSNLGEYADDVPLSMSGVDFLLKNKMNYQQWLETGISFCDSGTEAILQDRYLPTHGSADLDEHEQRWVQEQYQAVVNGIEQLQSFYAKKDDEGAQSLNEGAETTATVQPPLSFKLQQSISRAANLALHFKVAAAGLRVTFSNPSLINYSPYYASGSTVVLHYHKDAKKDTFTAPAAQELKSRTNQYSRLIGFRRLFKRLTQRTSKPLLGHNFASDLMFFLNQFDTPIPLTSDDVTGGTSPYEHFKDRVHDLFPNIFDTKVLSAALPEKKLGNTALEGLYKALSKERGVGGDHEAHPGATYEGAVVANTNGFSVSLPLGFQGYHPLGVSESAVAHQGAYDAFLTGIVYLYFVDQYGYEAVARQRNLIAVFGSLRYMNMSPSGRDPLASVTAVVVTMPHKYVSADFVLEKFLLSEDEKAERKEAQDAKGANKQLDPRIWAYGDSDPEKKLAIYHGLNNVKATEALNRAQNIIDRSSDEDDSDKTGFAFELLA